MMDEFLCGFFFLACGAALVFYNEPLVRRSGEFRPRSSRDRWREVELFERFLCAAAGVLTSVIGLLMMLSSEVGRDR